MFSTQKTRKSLNTPGSSFFGHPLSETTILLRKHTTAVKG